MTPSARRALLRRVQVCRVLNIAIVAKSIAQAINPLLLLALRYD
jgi:hypothetical protein